MAIPYKRLGNLVGGSLIAIMCFAGTIIMFRKSNLELGQMDKHTGVVFEKGITINSSKTQREVLYFRLQGLDQILAIYTPSQHYGGLNKKINLDDTLTVYFEASSDPIAPNLDTYQIEKGGTIILDKEEHQQRDSSAACIALGGCIFIFGIIIYGDRKYWKKNNER